MIANPISPIPAPFLSVSFNKFLDRFKTEEDCLEYLYNLKFSQGFICSKCNNNTSYKGVKPYTQVCKKCRHTESSTSNTLFHKVKFGLKNAFMIVYDMTTTTKGISSRVASRKYGINKDSAWLFMKKVRTAMESTAAYPMTGKVHVDEYVIGGHEAGAQGRKNKSKKLKVIMAVETTDKNRIKRMYSMRIYDNSTKEFRKIFDKHISKDATVYTDEWTSYSPLKEEWNIIQDKSVRNTSPANRMIQQQKSWLRATYHYVTKYHAMDYLNEFSFRINRSQWKDSIFHKCIERMVNRDKKNKYQLSQMECWSRELFEERVKQFVLWKIDFEVEVRDGKVKLVA